MLHCPECLYWARTAACFHEHYLAHKEAKVFKCSECEEIFKLRIEANEHIRKAGQEKDKGHLDARPIATQPVPKHGYAEFRRPALVPDGSRDGWNPSFRIDPIDLEDSNVNVADELESTPIKKAQPTGDWDLLSAEEPAKKKIRLDFLEKLADVCRSPRLGAPETDQELTTSLPTPEVEEELMDSKIEDEDAEKTVVTVLEAEPEPSAINSDSLHSSIDVSVMNRGMMEEPGASVQTMAATEGESISKLMPEEAESVIESSSLSLSLATEDGRGADSTHSSLDASEIAQGMMEESCGSLQAMETDELGDSKLLENNEEESRPEEAESPSEAQTVIIEAEPEAGETSSSLHSSLNTSEGDQGLLEESSQTEETKLMPDETENDSQALKISTEGGDMSWDSIPTAGIPESDQEEL